LPAPPPPRASATSPSAESAKVGLDTFDTPGTIAYAALGHLHGRHTLSETVRYSGSPLAYSFSEARHRKGGWLVDLDGGGLASAVFVDAPVRRRLDLVRGTLETLLTDPGLADVEQSWLHVTLTDTRRPREAMERLRSRFPHCLVIAFEPEGPAEVGRERRAPVTGRSDVEIVSDFVRDTRGAEPDAEEAALLQEACDACRVAEDIAS
jgi:exonuclease SbcD